MKLPTLISILCIFYSINSHAYEAKVNNLVEPVRYFTNHEGQLQEIKDKLTFYKKASLVGMTGIGKTQLARMYAYKNQTDYELIWCFDASLDLAEGFVKLAKEINQKLCNNGQCKLSEDPQNARKEVLSFLEAMKNWLLIFDNLKVNQNDKLKEIINWEHNGHIVICSQDSQNLQHSLQLLPLDKENTVKVIKMILSSTNDKFIDELVESFRGYPLLVAQGSIFLNNNRHMTVQEYNNQLKKSQNSIYSHVQSVLNSLTPAATKLLYKIALINNQKFSIEVLNKVAADKEKVSEELNALIRFGVINNVSGNQQKQVFEMHDMIKEAVLKIADGKVAQNNIVEIIDRINKLMPEGVSSRQVLLQEDETLLSNLEVLLQNAEDYKVDVYRVMELRRNLMNFYLNYLDYYNCQKMADWLLQKKESKFFLLGITGRDKAIYGWYLTDIGIFEDFAKAHVVNATKYLKEARDYVENLKGYAELKFTINAQLAQLYAFSSNIPKATNYINTVEEIMKAESKADLDVGLYWFIKAKISLMAGRYQEAMEANIKDEQTLGHLPQNTFTAPIYILRAEILNYMQNYQEALAIGQRIYEQETKNIVGDHEIHARILAEISRAKLGLGEVKQALEAAVKAETIHLKQEDINISTNTEFAGSIVAKAEALAKLGNIDQALEQYAIAERIYFNRYRKNMKYANDVSYMYLRALQISYNLPNKFWYNKFYSQFVTKFGGEHPRMKEIPAYQGSAAKTL